MKTKGKKLLLLTMILCAMAWILPTVKSEAASAPTVPKKLTVMYYDVTNTYKNQQRLSLSGIKLNTTVKFSNIKSSKASVLKAQKSGNQLLLTLKKPGTSVVSFKAKVSGKTYTYKCTVKVVKYANPFKSFTIGSKNYTSKFNKVEDSNWNFFGSTLSGKVKITTKSGWKLTELGVWNRTTNVYKKIKNNTTVKIKSGYTLECYLTNTKTGAKLEIFIAR